MSELSGKLKEVLSSVLPVTCIVLLLNFTVVTLEQNFLYSFLIGALFVTIGLTLFMLGIDQGLEPIGHGVSQALANSGRYAVVITASLILGFFISYAEPDLHILAKQVNDVTNGRFDNTLMVIAVSIGLGIMMTAGMLRILRNISLKYVFAVIYVLIFLLSLFSSSDFLAIAFDSSGATTGAITVPFMLAMAAGVSAIKKDSKLSEADSFGLIGIASSGAILGVLITGLFLRIDKLDATMVAVSEPEKSVFDTYISRLLPLTLEVFITLLPIITTYLVFQILFFKHKKQKVFDIMRGVLLTFIGLVLFLLGVNSGFMAVGKELGVKLASMHSDLPVLLVSLLLGFSTVLAEPAVHVLTNQVEEITGGSVKRSLVLQFLSVAVGLAIFISALRIIIPDIKLWMYLLPGFGLSVILAFFIPELFVGMAFDAGGVASGPMTATFSLAFMQGIATQVPSADVVSDGFGMIAIVAMMPIIAIELLGLLYKIKMRKAMSMQDFAAKQSR